MTQNEWILYTRTNCPLCDKAKAILGKVKRDTGIGYKEVDIYTDDDLTERFGLMIPVIEWQGKLVQYGQIDGAELLQFLMKEQGKKLR